ncbi:hypothetical protein AB0M28_39315 [Streptomyces sp. NPDC051940]|uniref:hypothetical protein n=1 Tax=Streptomyces sp. NPDC051940 TaxID=3155675 RepID=UPI00342D618C
MTRYGDMCARLMEQIDAGAEQIELRADLHWAAWGRLACLTYVAERFGYHYRDTRIRRPEGGTNRKEPVEPAYLVQLDRGTRAGHGQELVPAAGARTLPGLDRGNRRPLPEGADRVRELTARITLDSEAAIEAAQLKSAWWMKQLLMALPVGLLVLAEALLPLPWSPVQTPLQAALALAAVPLTETATRLIVRRKRAAAVALLTSRGYVEMHTPDGVVRRVPPDWTPPALPW